MVDAEWAAPEPVAGRRRRGCPYERHDVTRTTGSMALSGLGRLWTGMGTHPVARWGMTFTTTKRTRARKTTVRALVAVAVLVAGLTSPVASPHMTHAQTATGLTALSVTAGGTAQTLSPTFSSTGYYYTVVVASDVTEVTVAGTASGDGTVAYQDADGTTLPDADTTADGHQVSLPAQGSGTLINLEVSNTANGMTTTQTYAVRIIRDGTVATDRAALMALYNGTGGGSWTTSTNWGTSNALSTWAGVTTSSDGRVVALVLNDNQLSGVIPDLSGLTRLQRLSLDENQLSGEIPELSGLTSLQILSLSDNQLSGEIPDLSGLTSLEWLFLGGNQLSGKIPDLSGLTSLTRLELYLNQLSGEIPDLSGLTNLTRLDLTGNQLRGEIPDLSGLTSLQILSLGGNQLSGKIPDLSGLTSLWGLNLANNQLSGEIPDLSGLTSLGDLGLSSNQLSGEIPDLSGLTSLRWLGLGGNQLSGEIPDLSGLTSLQSLWLSNNRLSGEIPDLSGLTSLWGLHLDENRLSGEIPELSGLTSLAWLDLSNNQLSEEIPDLSGLTSLEILQLSENQLSGEIPDLSGLTSLEILELYLNQLSGEIPDLSGLTSLQRLWLSNNRLSGEIPDLSGLTSLVWLSLAGNQLSGEIPDLSGLTSLAWLDLYNNQLSGTIPAALGNLSGLVAVYLSGNAFTGCVPTRLQPLLHLPDKFGRPAHDFIAVDGVGLPFCNLSALAFSDVNLVPAFAAGTTTYTATVTGSVTSTTVSATTASQFHTAPFQLDVSVRKGTTTYELGDSVPLDRGTNHITVVATHSDGTPTLTYAVAVSRALNRPPTFPPTEDGQREVAEDAQPGDNIGDPVAATDPDPEALVYSLSGADADSFTIDSATGQLRVGTGVDLDHEGKRTYRVTVGVSDGLDSVDNADTSVDDTQQVTTTVTDVNEAPVVTGDSTASITENTSTMLAKYSATDPDAGDTVTWSVDDTTFWISDTGELYFRSPPSFEDGPTYTVSITATDDDPDNALASAPLSVTVTVTDVEEAGVLTITPLRGWVNTTFAADLEDGDGYSGETWQWARSSNRSSWEDITNGTSSTYIAQAADDGNYLRATVEYDQDGSAVTVSATLMSPIEMTNPGTNNAPVFTEDAPERSVGEGTGAGRNVGLPIRANDPDAGDVLRYSLSGMDADLFSIDVLSGQIRTNAVLVHDAAPSADNTYTVTVGVHDGFDGSYSPSSTPATIDVTITVTAAPVTRGFTGFVGGGGSVGRTPSEVEFEWTVKHDIDELDAGHDLSTGMWSDGVTLWLLENGPGSDDALYAYDLKTAERAPEREFELDEANRAPRGVWADRTIEILWVSDSGQNTLFAHDLESGERLPGRDIALAPRNRDARGIWSDGETMWVLDGDKNALFGYDLETGEPLAEYALDPANGDPRGLWSDGTTIWVSDDGAKRLFAYRLPVLPDDEADSGEDDAEAGPRELERVRDEEFRELSKASNNSPRGVWSDGDVIYVADAGDDRVYSYNMPGAIDALLASLTLSGVDIGEFSPGRTEYEGSPDEGAVATTVTAEARQRGAEVELAPPDADAEADGHQLALDGVSEITATVTSADGSRTRIYRVRLAEAPPEACLRGDVAEGFSLVLYEGGSVSELEDCAGARHVSALYATHDGGFVSHILGAPVFVNRDFAELYAGGVPPLTLLLAKSEGPATAGPGSGPPPAPWPRCLRGDAAAGFALVLYEGGGLDELAACARGRGVTALYATHGGAFVSYIPGAPAFVNRDFAELFAGDLPAATPLLARSEAPRDAN